MIPGRGAGDLGTLNFNLAWVPDVESCGDFLARDMGLFTQQGFSGVNLIPSGRTAKPQEQLVLDGSALIAVSSLDSTAASNQKGSGLRVIGARFQKHPMCIMSRAAKPLTTPQAMIGRRIGVQPDNARVWAAFLKANNIAISRVNTVSVDFDPTPLVQGQVDGWFSFVITEPVALALRGVATHTFLLADYNFDQVGDVFITTAASLKNDLPAVAACMTAEIIAWRQCIANPSQAAQLTVGDYPNSQSLASAKLQAVAQNTLIAAGDALTHGLFYVTPAAQAGSVSTLALSGIAVTANQLFDMSVLDAIYTARADLRSVPRQGTI